MSVYAEALGAAQPSDNTDAPPLVSSEYASLDDSSGTSIALGSLVTPALVGGYAVVGVYIGRSMLGVKGTLPLTTMALVAGTSAASAYAAPYLTQMVMCPRSPSAPLVEAAISSAISWQLLALTSGAQSATMFVPIQLGAYVAGKFIAPRLPYFSIAK